MTSWAISALLALSLAQPAAAQPFAICGDGPRHNCVVDGDTVWIKGEKIRLLNIDTAEMGPPKCSGPSPDAIAARDALARLLDGSIAIHRDGRDRYGRTLAAITVDGHDVGESLLAAGLARPYRAGQAPWC